MKQSFPLSRFVIKLMMLAFVIFYLVGLKLPVNSDVALQVQEAKVKETEKAQPETSSPAANIEFAAALK